LKKYFYIIPALGENCDLQCYKFLSVEAKKKGYTVKKINPNWYKSLSKQVFKPLDNSVLFGFSFGAILVHLVVEKHSKFVDKAIFASISPIHLFSYKELFDDYKKHMNDTRADILAKDIKSIKLKKISKKKAIFIAGELEDSIKHDILVLKTKHRLTKAYLKVISDYM
jgi:hypothetical protein